jgi:glycosyltransferase involved in cell wall biosynthesis
MEKDEMSTQLKPSVYMAMPCYDSVKINTMLSVFKLIQELPKSGIKLGINTMKSSLIHQARNYLSSVFLTTEYQYLLFIDSDVEFEPEAVIKMLVAQKDIVCTPYRTKDEDVEKHVYTVEFKDPEHVAFLPGGLVEIEAGPTGLMLIDRVVFERIIKNHPELKINNRATPRISSRGAWKGDSHDFYYNFFNFSFEDGYAMGEDISFCKLARKNDFRIYANTESPTTHHGSWGWKGKFKESFNNG